MSPAVVAVSSSILYLVKDGYFNKDNPSLIFAFNAGLFSFLFSIVIVTFLPAIDKTFFLEIFNFYAIVFPSLITQPIGDIKIVEGVKSIGNNLTLCADNASSTVEGSSTAEGSSAAEKVGTKGLFL
ncbi:MAG: hypothetical protein EOP34_00765 [Rickettsiales bacterium]|nr:MAG: hypothetical protein EOP34_00765 [Rickettsiales bacterium]